MVKFRRHCKIAVDRRIIPILYLDKLCIATGVPASREFRGTRTDGKARLDCIVVI